MKSVWYVDKWTVHKLYLIDSKYINNMNKSLKLSIKFMENE